MLIIYFVCCVIGFFFLIVFLEDCVTFRKSFYEYWSLRIDCFGVPGLPEVTILKNLNEDKTAGLSVTLKAFGLSAEFFTYVVPALVSENWFWCNQQTEAEPDCLINIGFGRKRAFCLNITFTTTKH